MEAQTLRSLQKLQAAAARRFRDLCAVATLLLLDDIVDCFRGADLIFSELHDL